MPETSETAESEKIGPDDLEKKKEIKLQCSPQFYIVLASRTLTRFLYPVNFFNAGTDLIFRRAGKASLHQKCLHKLLKIDALEERKFVKALPSQKGGY